MISWKHTFEMLKKSLRIIKDQIVKRPFVKWESFDTGSTENGHRHIFDKIVKSNIPFIQQKKYLCELDFLEEPSTDLFMLLDMIDTLRQKDHLEHNMCPTCLRKLKDKYPELDHLQ